MPSASIAIVGVGCRLPGAKSGAALLEGLARCARFPLLPPDRWDPDAFGAPPAARLLDDFDLDFRAFRLPPAQVASMHRMERAALAALRDALIDAGLGQAGPWGERCMVHMAASSLGLDPQIDHMARVRLHEIEAALHGAGAGLSPSERASTLAALDHMAPPITVDSLMTTAAMTAGRLCNAFDLGGGHLAYDAAGASSLAAIAAAISALEAGECDVAVVGAISTLVTATAVEAYRKRRLYCDGDQLALPGQPAHGTLLGEGALGMILEREADARAKGSRIYAVIRASGTATAGKRGVSASAEPVVARAARLALEATRFVPASIDYVECQAAGWSGFDEAELRAVLSVYGDRAARALPLASTAPAFGYLGAAAGMLSVVAAALAVDRGSRPAPPGGELLLADVGEQRGGRGITGPVSTARRVAVSSVGLGGSAYHILLARADDRRPRTSVTRQPSEQDRRVAIVGMGAVMPGAPDVTQLWRTVMEGLDAVGNIPLERWSAASFMPAASRGQPDASFSSLAGVLPPLRPEPGLLRMPPRSVDQLDGSVILTAQACAQAIEDATLGADIDPQRVAIVVGHLPLRGAEFLAERRALVARVSAAVARALKAQGVAESRREEVLVTLRRTLLEHVPELREETLDAMSSHPCAAQVAARFDFRGGVVAVDAACASSLVALHHGVGALMRGEVDTVVVAAAAYNLIPEYYVALATLGALARSGSHPFDEGDGMVPAEGAGALVLRRVADATRDRQRIYAVVRSVAISSDGRGTALLAPSSRGQQRALERAYAAAQLLPEQVDLVEAHGTGTRAGDAVELETYGAVFARRDPRDPIALGSIKSNVGHLSSAAGMAGLIKSALALHHRILPPMRHSGRPATDAAIQGGPLALNRTARPWRAPPDGQPRRAGVSAFGLGGINAHAILEEHVVVERRRRAPEPPQTVAPRVAARMLIDLAPVSRPAARVLEGPVLLLTAGEGARVRNAVLQQLAAARIACTELALPLGESLAELEDRVRPFADPGRYAAVLDLCSLTAPTATISVEDEALRTVRRASSIARAFYPDWEHRGGRLLSVTCMGGGLGFLPGDRVAEGGVLTGFMKALKQELPLLCTRVVDLDPNEDPRWQAETLLAELALGGDRVEVGYFTRRRLVPVLRAAPLRSAAPPLLSLEPGSVVLFSGGGRGVVFECACALARTGCVAVVTGRTSPPRGDEPWLELDDEGYEYLRREELIAARRRDASLTPARFAKEWEGRTSARQLHHNLRLAREEGLALEYHALDVTIASDCLAFVRALRARLGRLDGLVHGAMIEHSRALPGKTAADIDATVRVKVGGLQHLLDATVDTPLQFMCAFGSIAGRLGNRGQTDYAAANDAMARVLSRHGQRHPETRCVTIDWTAWGSVGAAASERTAALLRSAGVQAITPEEGTRFFLEELTHGAPGHSIVLVCPEPQAHDWPFIERSSDAVGLLPTVVDDRGQPLVPADWPMADALLAPIAADRLLVERLCDLNRDRYLAKHRLEDVPVLPGAFAVELLAEAAALATGGEAVHEIRDFVVAAPLRYTVRGGGQLVRTTVRVSAASGGLREVSTQAAVERSIALPTGRADRVHFRARVVTSSVAPVLPVLRPLAPMSGPGRPSLFLGMKSPLELGLPFQRIIAVERLPRGARAQLSVPSLRELFAATSAPRFLVAPLLLDAAFQVAAHWEGLAEAGWISIPVAFESLRVGTPSATAKSLLCEATVTGESVDMRRFDVRIDEDGRALLVLRGLRLQRLAPVDGAPAP